MNKARSPSGASYDARVQGTRILCAGVLGLGLAAGTAAADCPTQAANCLLHEEGVALLDARKFDEAATKFEASLVAGETARAALGYATALEGTGKLGLAYDAILEADRLSAWEVRGAPKDVDLHARAERIKYVLGELRSRIGIVRVQLPATVAPGQLAAVQREGRDVRDPRLPFAVTPGEDIIVVLRNGARYSGPTLVGAGGQSVWVVPLGGGPGVTVTPGATPLPATPVGAAPRPAVPDEAPVNHARVGLAFAVLPAGQEQGNTAYGLVAHGGIPLNPRFSLMAHLAYLPHEGFQTFDTPAQEFSGYELAAYVGGTMSLAGPIYLAADLGALTWSETSTVSLAPGSPASTQTDDRWYLVYAVGAGLHIGHFDARLGVEGPFASLGHSLGGSEPALAVRTMVSIGADFHQW